MNEERVKPEELLDFEDEFYEDDEPIHDVHEQKIDFEDEFYGAVLTIVEGMKNDCEDKKLHICENLQADDLYNFMMTVMNESVDEKKEDLSKLQNDIKLGMEKEIERLSDRKWLDNRIISLEEANRLRKMEEESRLAVQIKNRQNAIKTAKRTEDSRSTKIKRRT